MVCFRSIGVAAGLLAGIWIALEAQSAPGTWAIVGARIVDGSGNEPFTGTLVVEGGRIRAAGRSVEVPSGALTIDGAGRTVLPGLIDSGVHLAPGADKDAVEQQRRALAALLYSGVTTVAVAGPDGARFDALQREAGRADAGPRLVLLQHPRDAPSIADALAQRLSTADAGLDPAAIAAHAQTLIQGNVTVLPAVIRLPPAGDGAMASLAAAVAEATVVDLAAPTAEGDVAASASTVRALRDGRVRLAIRSDAGRPARAYGWSTHRAAHLLVEWGLTPLEAVTAATSGGAWGLQVHSDRGFIAAGMRADLLLVEGDPTTAIGDLARIDRVFLGGQEVDRTALRARLEPRPATPPTAAAKPPAAPRASATPATTVGKLPVPAPPVEKPARAARRGRDIATARPGAPKPAPQPAEAPELESPAGQAAVSPGTEPSAPVPPAPAPGTGRSEPAPAPVTAGPSPGPAAAPALEAAPARAALATAPLGNPLLDDFEREDERSAQGVSWATTTESAGRTTTVIVGRVIRAFRDHAMHLTARMGDGASPFARATLPLTPDGQPRDVSRFRGLRFDARGEGRYRIVFVTRSVADGRYHETYFSGSPNWTPVSVPFASVGQNGSGQRVGWTGRDLVEIRFEASRDGGRLAWLELDNLRFY